MKDRCYGEQTYGSGSKGSEQLVPELARCIGFLRREMKKVTVQGVLEIHPTTGINDAKFDM